MILAGCGGASKDRTGSYNQLHRRARAWLANGSRTFENGRCRRGDPDDGNGSTCAELGPAHPGPSCRPGIGPASAKTRQATGASASLTIDANVRIGLRLQIGGRPVSNPWKGRCLCGAVQFEARRAALAQLICHCGVDDTQSSPSITYVPYRKSRILASRSPSQSSTITYATSALVDASLASSTTRSSAWPSARRQAAFASYRAKYFDTSLRPTNCARPTRSSRTSSDSRWRSVSKSRALK
ncbi:GFA family protein [Trinickia soli]|uniref:GFA family protein n=1 Tax=Trinickia soli TaxID=380675 RepID=UPI003FA3D733